MSIQTLWSHMTWQYFYCYLYSKFSHKICPSEKKFFFNVHFKKFLKIDNYVLEWSHIFQAPHSSQKWWWKLSCKLSSSCNVLFCSMVSVQSGPDLLSTTSYLRVRKPSIFVYSKILTVVLIFIRAIMQNVTSQRYCGDAWGYYFSYLHWIICGEFKFQTENFGSKPK